MDTQILIAAILTGIFIFFILIFAFAFQYHRKARQTKAGRVGNDWIFTDWSTSLYDSLTKADPAVVGHKIGFNVNTYIHNCEIMKIQPKIKDIVVKKMIGFILLGSVGVGGLLLSNIFIIVFGMLAAIPLIFFEIQKVDKQTKLIKFQIINDLPRFIDLFQTALLINIPVEDAILITAKSLSDTLLAQELLSSIAGMQMGIYDWQAAMEYLAEKYEIDVLSDFTLDLVTTYNKGVPIADAVARKGKEIKQTNLLSMKERASKLTSTILLPILGFKVFPLLALLCIPIIQQIANGL